MKKSKRTLIPKLRFPEFRGEPGWKEVPLEQIAERTTTKNLDGSIARVLTNSAEHGILDQRDYFDKDIANAGNIDGYYIVDLGDYVYNPRISTLAPVGPISRNNIGKGVMSPLYTVFRFTDENTDFYQHYFKTVSWHLYLRRVSSMGARHDRMSITTGDFMAMPVPTPLPHEQKKIAECLSSLDGLIAAEGRKLAALRDHKRGLMQQLFPQPGQTQPRLRFPEFRNKGGWTSKKLGQAATFFNGRAYQKDELLDEGKYKVLRVGNFFTNDQWYHSDLELDETKYCEEGDLLYAWSASFGPRIWHGERVIYHYHIWKVVESEGINKHFLFVCLDRETERMKTQSANGLGLLHITKGTIEGWDCVFPEIDEQIRIADCLTALDTRIAAQAAKIDALKTHKRGLMQQLFPASEEQ